MPGVGYACLGCMVHGLLSIAAIRLGHSKRCVQNRLQKPNFEKLRDPSHFLGPIYVNPKRPFPATKSSFEVNKGRTDVLTSRYERIVKFDKVFVTGVEVFVTSHKDLCLVPFGRATLPRSDERPFPIVWKIQTGFARTVWSGLTLTLTPHHPCL